MRKNYQKCQIIFSPTHQQRNRFLSGWPAFLSVDGQSCFPKLLPIIFITTKDNSGSFSKTNLFASISASNPSLDDQRFQPHHFPPSKFTISPIKSFTHKSRQTLLQLNTSNSKGSDGIPAILLKICAPELAPILKKLFSCPTVLTYFLRPGN